MTRSVLIPPPLHVRSTSDVENPTKRTLPSPTSEQGLKRTRSLAVTSSTSLNPLACCHCRQTFSVPFALHRHEATVHSDGRRFRCQDCRRTFSRKDTFDRHRATHTKSGFVSCRGCMKVMRSDYLRTHFLAKSNRRCALAQTSSSSSASATSGDDVVQSNETHGNDADSSDDADKTQTPDSDLVSMTFTPVVNNKGPICNKSSMVVDRVPSFPDPFAVCEDPILPVSSHSSDAAALASVLAFSAASDNTPHFSITPDVVRLRSDPLLLDCDDNLADLPDELRDDLRRWRELQSRAARTPAKDQSSVGQQVRKHLCNVRSGVKRKPVFLGPACNVCGVSFGSIDDTMIAHVKSHLEYHPQPRFECTKCNIEFLFQRDFQLHCQRRTNSSFATECEQLCGTIAGIWINQVIAERFVQDLRLWERFQVCEYVDQTVASIVPCLSKKQSAASLPDRWSDSSRAFGRQSITSYRSYTSSARPSRSDLATLSGRLESVVLGQSTERCGLNDMTIDRNNLTFNCLGAKSPLMKAFRMGRFDLLLGVLRDRTPHICNLCERYTLCSACMEGRTEVVLALMNAGVDPHAQGPAALPYRPLDLAMMRDRTDIVKLLLKMGANARSHHASYFIRAAKLGETSVMRYMISAGFDADSTIGEESVLALSAKRGYEDAVQVLLESGANSRVTDKRGLSPLHHASKEGHVLAVRHLLDAGADVHAHVSGLNDLHSTTPLMLACSRGRLGVVGMLLARKVKVNTEDTLGRTALHYTCEAGTTPHSDAIAHQLLAAGANIDHQDVSAMTPLMYASSSGSLSVVQTLLIWGADTSARAHSGLNALMRARKFGQRSVAHVLETWMGNHLEPESDD